MKEREVTIDFKGECGQESSKTIYKDNWFCNKCHKVHLFDVVSASIEDSRKGCGTLWGDDSNTLFCCNSKRTLCTSCRDQE